MWASVLGCTVLVLFTVLTTGKAEIYIVRVEGEPIISYKGGVDGFEATAVESDEKIDTTRYLFFFFFPEHFVVMKCVWNFISWTRLLSQCHTMLASLICLDHFNNVWNIEASVVSEYIFLVGSGLVRYLYRTVDIC